MRFEVDVQNLEEVSRKVQDGIAAACVTAVRAAVTEGADEARRLHPFKGHTGKLFSSIRGYMTDYANGDAKGILEAGVNPSAPYASYVENGTAPHVIFAKPRFNGDDARPGVLHWVGSDGEDHFAPYVNHPGTKPYPFMGPALLKAQRVIEREISLACAKLEQS